MARPNPVLFLRQVRQETAKVTWPGRQEIVISAVMVIVLVVLASLFFLLSDQLLSWIVALLLSIR